MPGLLLLLVPGVREENKMKREDFLISLFVFCEGRGAQESRVAEGPARFF